MVVREEDIAEFYGVDARTLRRYKNGSDAIKVSDDKLRRRYDALREGYIKFLKDEL